MSSFVKQLLCPAVSLLMIVGCGESDGGPSVDELVHRQQVREMAELSREKTPAQRLRVARKYLSDGNAVAAERELRPLLIARPEDPQVILLSARIEAATGDKLAATEMLGAIDPADTDQHQRALWLEAEWLADAHRYAAAEAKLKRMLKISSGASRVHRKLATMLNHQGRRMEAAEHLRALARCGDISEKELFAMNTLSDPFIDDSKSKREYDQLFPLAEARRLRAEGELHRAGVLVEQLRRQYPDSPPIAAFQGRVYSELHDERRLRSWLDGLPEGIEREPEYWYAVGNRLQRQGRHREAVRCLGEAVARDETERFGYLALARSLEVLGEERAARRANERFQLLAEAARIAEKIGYEPGAYRDLNRMADILVSLRRPWEAISWREIALKVGGSPKSKLDQLRAKRQTLAEQEAAHTPENFATCGLELARWPLPSAGARGVGESLGVEPAGKTLAVENPIVLENVADEARLSFQYDNGDDPSDDAILLHQVTGGGLGVIDLDLDGWSDIYMAQGGGDAFDPDGSKPNRMFRNLHGTRFVDATGATRTGDRGYGQGVAVADINQDGFPDMVCANIGPNILYLNNADGTFSSRRISPPGGDVRWTTSVACADLTGDQLPEIVAVNYVDDPAALEATCTPETGICNPSLYQPAADRIWRVDVRGGLVASDGGGDMSNQPSYGFAAVIANLDGKAGNDLFVANDTQQNHCWINRANGRRGKASCSDRSLVQSSQVYGCANGLVGQPQGCMGVAHGDFDRNGLLDLHVTNYWDQPADLYLQQPGHFFVNANAKRGIYSDSRATVGWGTQAVDFDRNGWLDLAVLNGHVIDYRSRGENFKMRPQLFRGAAGGFRLVEPGDVGGDYWQDPALGRTMAVMDWNQDLKPDLVANHLDAPVALLENRTGGGNSVRLELVGTDSERDAVGTEVTLRCGEESWTGQVAGGDGFLCSNEPVLDFGIGAAETVDLVQVRWPSGATQQFHDLPANQLYLIVEGDSAVFLRK